MRNAFDHYGVAREPYLGNPDRSRAPLSPFPGPGGGKGVFVRVDNGWFVTEYAHLDVGPTVTVLPPAAFLSGFGPDTDYETLFAPLRDFQSRTPVARWQVRRADLVGFSGDSGYSEAPHLHYTVSRAGGALLCATDEAGFDDGGRPAMAGDVLPRRNCSGSLQAVLQLGRSGAGRCRQRRR